MFVRYSMSIIILKKIVESMYCVCPIFDVDYYTRENSRTNVLCSSDISHRFLHWRRLSSQRMILVRLFDVDYYTSENRRSAASEVHCGWRQKRCRT